MKFITDPETGLISAGRHIKEMTKNNQLGLSFSQISEDDDSGDIVAILVAVPKNMPSLSRILYDTLVATVRETVAGFGFTPLDVCPVCPGTGCEQGDAPCNSEINEHDDDEPGQRGECESALSCLTQVLGGCCAECPRGDLPTRHLVMNALEGNTFEQVRDAIATIQDSGMQSDAHYWLTRFWAANKAQASRRRNQHLFSNKASKASQGIARQHRKEGADESATHDLLRCITANNHLSCPGCPNPELDLRGRVKNALAVHTFDEVREVITKIKDGRYDAALYWLVRFEAAAKAQATRKSNLKKAQRTKK